MVPGDQLSIIVLQDPDLSLEKVAVDDAGTIQMPLLGEVVAADRHRPAKDDKLAHAAWRAGKQALPKAFANLAWKARGASEAQRFADRRKLLRLAPRHSVIAALRQIGARVLPERALKLARRMRQHRKERQNGLVDFGDLARLRPLDPYFGFGRGQPIDLYYIESFLARHAAAITGHVLEVGDPAYSQRFGSGITRQDVLNKVPGHPATTIIGDLAEENTLEPGSFDCIIVTQTLQMIYDLKAVVAELRRGLRPGGAVLVTVPGISALADHEWDWYWFLTGKSATRLFADEFGAENVEVSVAGNLFAANCFLYGIAVEEVGEQWLEPYDPDYPVIISIIARKPA